MQYAICFSFYINGNSKQQSNEKSLQIGESKFCKWKERRNSGYYSSVSAQERIKFVGTLSKKEKQQHQSVMLLTFNKASIDVQLVKCYDASTKSCCLVIIVDITYKGWNACFVLTYILFLSHVTQLLELSIRRLKVTKSETVMQGVANRMHGIIREQKVTEYGKLG